MPIIDSPWHGSLPPGVIGSLVQRRAGRACSAYGMPSVGERPLRRRTSDALALRQHKVLEKKCGELRAPPVSRLLVHGHGMLSHRPFAAPRGVGNGLVALSLEEQKRHLALGGSESPALELVVDRPAESRQSRLRACSPRVALRLPRLQSTPRLAERVR